MTTRSGTRYQAPARKANTNSIHNKFNKALAAALAVKLNSSAIPPFPGMDANFKCDSRRTFIAVVKRELNTLHNPLDPITTQRLTTPYHFCCLCKIMIANYHILRDDLNDMHTYRVVHAKIKEIISKLPKFSSYRAALIKYEKVFDEDKGRDKGRAVL